MNQNKDTCTEHVAKNSRCGIMTPFDTLVWIFVETCATAPPVAVRINTQKIQEDFFAAQTVDS